jgi:hypothetical protein
MGTNRRGFLKGLLGAGAGAVVAPTVLKEKKAEPVMKQTEFETEDLYPPASNGVNMIETTYCVCAMTSSMEPGEWHHVI